MEKIYQATYNLTQAKMLNNIVIHLKQNKLKYLCKFTKRLKVHKDLMGFQQGYKKKDAKDNRKSQGD